MLSSVSYVCLGMCAGMWEISRGIYLGVRFCLSSQSCCSSVRVIHYEQGGICRALSEISRRDLRTCRFEITRDLFLKIKRTA